MSPMNTEEVYRSLRKTTAEIQNYTFESKLGRDTNSKDSGISQMDDQQSAATVVNDVAAQNSQPFYSLQLQQQPHQTLQGTNGFNAHLMSQLNKDATDSRTQSSTTTESISPEITVRIDGDYIQTPIFTPRYSTNVTFLPSGELVTECEFFYYSIKNVLYTEIIFSYDLIQGALKNPIS